MANYYQLIARAIAELKPDSSDKRKVVYERARTALLDQLANLVPPLGEIERTKERLALEEAFRRIEAAEERAAERGLSFAEFERHMRTVDRLGRLADALQHSHGAPIGWRSGRIGFTSGASPADVATANDPFNRDTHLRLRSSSKALDEQASRLRHRAQWPGLIRAIDVLRELFELPPAEVAGQIGAVWALTISLRAYVDRTEDALWQAIETEGTLDATMLRAVKDFVLIATPWVRRFPGGRALDGDIETWAGPHGDLAAAAALRDRVAQANLFADRSGEIVLIALDAGQGESVQATRARCWAIGTMQNVGIALVRGLRAAAERRVEGGDGSTPADIDLAAALEQIVTQGREELAALLTPLARDLSPEDVRAGLLAASP